MIQIINQINLLHLFIIKLTVCNFMNKKNKVVFVVLFSIVCFFSTTSFSQEKLIELTGQLFFESSDEPVEEVEVYVEGTKRSTYTNEMGNFSIVVKPNETVVFSALGLMNSYYKVPDNITANYLVIKQYISIDSTYMKEVVITKYLSKEEFDYLMKYGYIPDENLLASRNNMSEENKTMFIHRSPYSYYESQLMLQQNILNRHGSYYGQQTQATGINAFDWYDLFKSWKKNKNKTKR